MLTHPPAERHQALGEAVVRAIRSALDSLTHDLPATGRVLAIGELREALRLIEREGVDAP